MSWSEPGVGTILGRKFPLGFPCEFHELGLRSQRFGGPGTPNGLPFSHIPLNQINLELQNSRCR